MARERPRERNPGLSLQDTQENQAERSPPSSSLRLDQRPSVLHARQASPSSRFGTLPAMPMSLIATLLRMAQPNRLRHASRPQGRDACPRAGREQPPARWNDVGRAAVSRGTTSGRIADAINDTRAVGRRGGRSEPTEATSANRLAVDHGRCRSRHLLHPHGAIDANTPPRRPRYPHPEFARLRPIGYSDTSPYRR